MRASHTLSALGLLSLSACDPLVEKPADEDLGGCVWTTTAVAMDEVTELGISANDLLALSEGERAETFTYAQGGTAALSLSVSSLGTAAVLTGEPIASETDVYYDCPTTLSVDVTVGFSTDDGAFAESWDTALTTTADTVSSAFFWVELDPDALGGSYDFSADITEPDYDERSLWASGQISAEGAWGEIAGQVSGSDDCADGDECSAWASMVEVGQWGEQSM